MTTTTVMDLMDDIQQTQLTHHVGPKEPNTIVLHYILSSWHRVTTTGNNRMSSDFWVIMITSFSQICDLYDKKELFKG